MDSHGRIFYINHAARSTTWVRPGQTTVSKLQSVKDLHRQQLNRRYKLTRNAEMFYPSFNTIPESSKLQGVKISQLPPT